MRDPLLSVIVPCYNGGRYLVQALRSVMWQTCGDWECILVDDGSTDASASVFRECAAEDDRFRYERQDHAGASAARNRGVQMARGEFVQFLDSDDVLLPEKLRLSAERLRAAPTCGAVYSDYACLGVRREFFKILPGRIPGDDPAKEFLFGLNRTFVVPIHAFVFRREILTAYPFDVALHSYAEDMDCWIRIAASGARFEFLPEILVVYRLRPDSLAANEARITEAKLSLIEKYGKEPWALAHPDDLREARNFYQERLAIGQFMDRSFGRGWRTMVGQWSKSGWSSRVKMLTWFLLLLVMPKRTLFAVRAWAVSRLGLRLWGWSDLHRWTPPQAVRELLLSAGPE